MPERDPQILLDDIHTAIEKVGRYTSGLRNRIVHDYFGLDLKIIWQIVQTDMPALKTQIAELQE